jgi:thymidylate synthase (FAD)
MTRTILPTTPPGNYRSRLDRGVENIEVRLIDAPDPNEAARTVAAFAETTFGDIPDPRWMHSTEARKIAQDAAEFKHVIPNALETVALTFTIDGVSRACTHQLVRTRVGAGFGQFSQRANHLGGFNMRIPESFYQFLDPKLLSRYIESLDHLNRFYNAAVDAGVPYQDARFVVPEGVETSITVTYNLLALIGTVRRRVCNRMQWEINYIARRMADETVKQLPWVGKALRASCERTGTCQTVDPMFSPSCLFFNEEVNEPEWCQDNAALRDLSHGQYNWPSDHNGSVMLFKDTDRARVAHEHDLPGQILSLVDGQTLLAHKDRSDLWTVA